CKNFRRASDASGFPIVLAIVSAASRGLFWAMVCTISSENLSGFSIVTGSADNAGTASASMAPKASFRMFGMVAPPLFALTGVSEAWLGRVLIKRADVGGGEAEILCSF